jgi:alkylation response protein AidB-like acyl-CoA dehydrogenase
MIMEELGRGWSTVAGLVAAQVTAAHLLERFADARARERLVPAMIRGERWGAVAAAADARVERRAGGWSLAGAATLVDNAERADAFLLIARGAGGDVGCFLVPRGAERLAVSAPPATLGARGLGAADVAFDGVPVDESARLGDAAPRAAGALVRLALAASAVGLAQAAFEAALRYSQQRSAFGQPICQHQAVQLKLADMATRITTARLLTARAAERLDADAEDDIGARLAKIEASESAAMVALEAMRIHGGYGYTNEFPIERFYRDAARLLVTPTDNDAERRLVAERVARDGPAERR